MGANEDVFFLVKCPSIRGKPEDCKYNPNAKCNRVLGFFSKNDVSIVQCNACKIWYKIDMPNNSISVFDKKKLNFKNIIKLKVISYAI